MLLRRWLVARKWSSLVKLAVLSANFSAVSHMVCSSSSREQFTGKVLCKPSALLHTGYVHSAKGRIQFGSCSSKIVGDQYNTVHTGVVRAADPQFCSQYNTLPSFLGCPSVINTHSVSLSRWSASCWCLAAAHPIKLDYVLVSLGAVVLNYCSASPVRCITVI